MPEVRPPRQRRRQRNHQHPRPPDRRSQDPEGHRTPPRHRGPTKPRSHETNGPRPAEGETLARVISDPAVRLVLTYDLPSPDEAVAVMKGRLGSPAGQISWSKVQQAAGGLNQAKLVKAAEVAAKRSIPAGEKRVAGVALADSLRDLSESTVGRPTPTDDGRARQPDHDRRNRSTGSRRHQRRWTGSSDQDAPRLSATVGSGRVGAGGLGAFLGSSFFG